MDYDTTVSAHEECRFAGRIATAEDVREELEKLVGCELPVDFASLDTLESFLLRRYPSYAAGLTLEHRGVLDASSRHVGLVLVLAIDGARWDIDVENERNVYYRLPVVVLPEGTVECPISMITTSLDRRTGTFMRELAEGLAAECANAKPATSKKAKSKSTPRRKR